jgi:hypothetical protein
MKPATKTEQHSILTFPGLQIRQGIFLALQFVLVLTSRMPAQENQVRVNTDREERHRWESSWITHPEASVYDYGVFHFRNTFQLDEVPLSQVIHVSADNRYRLYVNGQQVSAGPARGSLHYWRYETLDIAPFLKEGKNLVAAEVFNLGEYKPVAQFSHQTAFILQAEGGMGKLLNTGRNPSWKVHQNKAYRAILVTREIVRKYYVVGPCDSIHAARYPWGWEGDRYDDSGWKEPREICTGAGRGYMHGIPWLLVPRNIPPMEERIDSIGHIIRIDGQEVSGTLLKGGQEVLVPAGTRRVILLDNRLLTIGYPVLRTRMGKGSVIRVTYSEALYNPDLSKGNRNDFTNKHIEGYYDVFLPDGGENAFRPLWLRTFRFIQLEIETSLEPLLISGYQNHFTAYPFEQNASFECDDPMLTKIWETGWRTARLCAGETYMDCPYWEQLQYLGDTRIQALVSLYNSGDDRLMRNALEQADQSRIPEGLTMSRGPSYEHNVIPAFSLYWIAMVHDYYMHRQDDAFLRQFLPGIRSVLGWFEERTNGDDMLGALDWFNFADWAQGFAFGAPAGADTGYSALVSLNYAYALERAAEIFGHFGCDPEAERYMERAQEIARSVNRLCWDPARELLTDLPGQPVFSQHTNIFGILTGAIPVEQQARTMQRILEEEGLIQATIYFRFYLFRAMAKTGFAEDYLGQLKPWEEMIRKGLTTFEEGDYDERSDCHAWSASPNYDLLATVCGITPAEPGFRSVNIRPAPGPLKYIRASMPHPAGEIRIEFNREANGGLKGFVELPENVGGSFYWKGKTIPLKGGRTEIRTM